jgi:hypothetical protein
MIADHPADLDALIARVRVDFAAEAAERAAQRSAAACRNCGAPKPAGTRNWGRGLCAGCRMYAARHGGQMRPAHPAARCPTCGTQVRKPRRTRGASQ